jgi:hypothetical protein
VKVEPTGGADVTLEAFGAKANVRNVRSLNTGLTMATLVVVCCLGVAAYFHEAAAQKREEAASVQLAESNRAVAKVLQETNAATKENTAAVVGAIKSLAQQTKIVACLNDPTLRNRSDAYEFCKRQHAREER